jgi:hypothetical protein
MIIKGFIEVHLPSGALSLVSITSIAAVEPAGLGCRIILKEKVADTGLNHVIHSKFDYYFVKGSILKSEGV